MTPIRLLFTIPNFETAGSGRALLHVARRLDRRRFAPSICVRYRAYNAIEGEIESLGIPLVEAPTTVDARPLRSLLGRCRRAAAPLRGFDLWHSFHYLDDYTEALVARFAGARWIYTKKNMSWNHRSWWLRSWLARRIAVQNTDMMASFFGPRWLRQRAELVPRGVDLERFLPEGPGRPDLREGLGEDVLLVACVAHLVPVKGHPTLLRAVAQVPGLHLLIAGRPLDADYAESLGQLSEELGIADRVRFLGGVAEVDRLLR
ncbi:MAG: glycosyltransferase family 4 protein, partial [Acidobacteriota bacterium]